MKFLAKIKWIASILLVFFIVLVTNIIDRDNFNKLSYSVKTMYEDRIVAGDLLFEISRVIQDKKIAILSSENQVPESERERQNKALEELIKKYSQTKLTEKEQFIFNQLQDELKSLKQKERNALDKSNPEALENIEKIDQNLYDLSKIQLEEGKRQVSISDQTKDTINLFTQAEIIFLILMAVLIQIIILYKPIEVK